MKYIQRYILADAWQMSPHAEDLPPWLVRKEFARVFSEGDVNGDKVFSHGLLASGDKTITVCTGVWVVLDHNGLCKMTDAEFKAKFEPAFEVQDELFVHHTAAEDAPEWFPYDSSKPASMLSVRDHVILEFVKVKLSKVSSWTEIEEDEVESFVDWVLLTMGYD
jgi:hypothetical protein